MYLHRLRMHAFACLRIVSACLYGSYVHLYDPRLQENYRSRTRINAPHPRMLLVILKTISRTRNRHLSSSGSHKQHATVSTHIHIPNHRKNAASLIHMD